ncbi:hypothetical protein TQ38_026720 (plasmid) [Novosphingobium sp. P6W]|nr:hypothetical protein TQ38_026720 [Novosphingobium sp. P6W]KIS29989.1 hypothetical protein TQ38_25120 [Novosphingobium sp. P6W]
MAGFLEDIMPTFPFAVEASRMNDPRLWFGPKRLGFGITPRTREGWLITLALVLAVITAKQMM